MTHSKASLRSLIIIVGMLWMLTGCTVELAYNNLDRLVLRWINDKVDLTDAQRQHIRQALDSHLAWHCEAHLPAYADLLEKIRADIVTGSLDSEKLTAYGDEITHFGQELIEISRPTVVSLLSSLSNEQIEVLHNSFEESNQQLIERLAQRDPRSILEERTGRMEKRLARFMGKLNNQQAKAIRDWAEAYQDTAGFQLAYAYQWQSQLLDALAIRTSDPLLFSSKIEVLFDPGAGWSDAYRSAVSLNQSSTWKMMATVMGQLSDRQVTRLTSKVSAYAEDFDGLSCRMDSDWAYQTEKKEAPLRSLSYHSNFLLLGNQIAVTLAA